MTLSVYDIIKSQNAILHDDGLLIYDHVKKAINQGNLSVEVNFENVKRCTTLFLNASFGKLLAEFGEEFMRKSIHPESHSHIISFMEKYGTMWDNVINKENYQAFREEAYA